MMAEQSLPIHSKYRAFIPSTLSSHFAFSHERSLWWQQSFLARNLRAFLGFHSDTITKQQAAPVNARHFRSQQESAQPGSALLSNAATDQSQAQSDKQVIERPTIDAVSRNTLMIKAMSPVAEPSARRSVRHLTQRILDDDDAELLLEPTSIRTKINFKDNRPVEAERPRQKSKLDNTVRRARCHCTLTIWDNRREKAEAAAVLIEKNTSCWAAWARSERNGHVVDVDLDKPFTIRAGDLKVVVERDGESSLGISDNYYMEIKIWPTKECKDWPPIPLLGKSDGDVNRPNKFAHHIISGSLVAKYSNLKYHNLLEQPQNNTPLSVFYLDDQGGMLRTKYGLEISGRWNASKTKQKSATLQNEIPWAFDDSNNLFGRKRACSDSAPESPPKRRNGEHKSPPRQRGGPKTPTKRERAAVVRYIWEADPADAMEAQEALQTIKYEGLGCPACPTYDAQDLSELRFHFLGMHSRFNFALCDDDYDQKGDLISALFRVSSVVPSKRRRDDDKKQFQYLASSSPFNLTKYLQGDTSWTRRNESRLAASKSRGVQFEPLASGSAVVPDPLVLLRARNGGHLPIENVPKFRDQHKRPKYKPAHLIRRVDGKKQMLDSIAHRPIDPSEDAMSETDDEREVEWYIQRHQEILDADAAEYGRDKTKQELFRRWDRHRFEENLDHIAFLSESLYRFVNRNRQWIQNGNNHLKRAFGELTSNLLGDRLINDEVERNIRSLVWRGGTADHLLPENDSAQKPDSVTGAESSHDAQNVSPLEAQNGNRNGADLETLDQTTNNTTTSSFAEYWQRHLNQVPSTDCPVCSKPISEEVQNASTPCSVRNCKTPSILYHLKCVHFKLKKPQGTEQNSIIKTEKGAPYLKSAGWKCPGCRFESDDPKDKPTEALLARFLLRSSKAPAEGETGKNNSANRTDTDISMTEAPKGTPRKPQPTAATHNSTPKRTPTTNGTSKRTPSGTKTTPRDKGKGKARA